MSDKQLWWGAPFKSQRFHIFEGQGLSKSLCGKWMFVDDGNEPDVDVENDTFTDGDDCKACSRKVGILDE